MIDDQVGAARPPGVQPSTAELLVRIEREQREIAARKRLGLPSAQETFHAMVRDELSPGLRTLGFKGSGRVFRMAVGSHLAAIDIQSSAWNSALEVRFTLNVAIVERAAWQAEQDPAHAADRFFTPSSVMPGPNRARVGVLATGHDRWWTLPADANMVTLGAAVLHDVTNYALPWFRARAGSADD